MISLRCRAGERHINNNSDNNYNNYYNYNVGLICTETYN